MSDERIPSDNNLNESTGLTLPSMSPRGLLSHFGPGIVLMMTGIGTSHLITAPTAGGRFEYALLWCIPASYIFKYYGFEMAFRFTNATGKSLIDAYGTAKFKWPVWYMLIVTIIECALGQAGRLIAAAAVMYYLFTESMALPINPDLATYGLVLGVISVAILLRGNYSIVEKFAKILAGLLLLSTLTVYFKAPAPLSEMGHFFLFETPSGSWLIIAGFLGLLPTGMDVSLQASEWGSARRLGMARIRPEVERAGLAPTFDPFGSPKEDLSVDASRIPSHMQEYCRRWFRIGLWDFRFGHVASFIIATIFLLLAAVWIYPSPVEGRAVMGEIAGIFTQSVGPWMMIVFMIGAFAATFSTSFNYFDGWPRLVAACCRNLFPATAKLKGIEKHHHTSEDCSKKWYSEYNIYRITMIYSLIAAVIFIALIPRPVYMVLIASALAFFVAPIIFYLNLYYCMTVIPKTDKIFYPRPFERYFAWFSLAVFSGMIVILFFARVLNIPLFGI